jgi:hypothetical protein
MQIRAGQEAVWQKFQDNNTDPYGGRVVSYARDWAGLMEEWIARHPEQPPGAIICQVAKQTSDEADYDGITGFMYGAAVSTLAAVWEHGELLRRWHNGETQLGTEGDEANKTPGAVLNPALLTISR